MMIPERLTSAAGCLGVWGALDLAMRYANQRRSFGKEIRKHQAISFKIADAITQLDASRAITYMAARAADKNYPNVRRLVSEAKKFATEAAWDIVNSAMQPDNSERCYTDDDMQRIFNHETALKT